MYRDMVGTFICMPLVVTLYSLQMKMKNTKENLVLQVLLLVSFCTVTTWTTRTKYGNETKMDSKPLYHYA